MPLDLDLVTLRLQVVIKSMQRQSVLLDSHPSRRHGMIQPVTREIHRQQLVTGHLIILLGNLIQGPIGLGLAIQLYEYLYKTPDTHEMLPSQMAV
jgi:hypothetical protein